MADGNTTAAEGGTHTAPGGTRAGEAPVHFWRGPRSWGMHFLLAGVGFFFLFPLLWMMSTSLKPLAQTTEVPPRMLPYATFATIHGERAQVTVGERVGYPGHIVVIGASPKGYFNRDGSRARVDPASFALTDRAADAPALPAADRVGPQPAGAHGFARVEFANPDAKTMLWVPVTVEKNFVADDRLIQKFHTQAEIAAQKVVDPFEWDVQPQTNVVEEVSPQWQNYPDSLARMNFWQYLFNTIFVCLMTVGGIVVSSVLIAYAFAFLPFPGRGPLFIITLATMMVPFPVTMIIMYNLFRDLGWLGSFKPLWVPAWFGSAFFIFLLRQFFLSLPKELLDAARMDGCTELEILWHVVLPLSRPAIAMVALFTFLGCWSDYMGPLLYLSNKDSFTLALGLANYRSQHGGTEWNLLMAANLVFSLPLIILFLFTLKTFIKGIATTGMKG